jgi:hypothetical protein
MKFFIDLKNIVTFFLMMLFVPALIAMHPKRAPKVLAAMPTNVLAAAAPAPKVPAPAKRTVAGKSCGAAAAGRTMDDPGKENVAAKKEEKTPKKVALPGSAHASVSGAAAGVRAGTGAALVELKIGVPEKKEINFSYLKNLALFVKMQEPWMHDPNNKKTVGKIHNLFENLSRQPLFQAVYQDLEAQLDIFAQVMKKQLNDEKIWTTGKPGPEFFNLKSGLFTPYVQKIQIPTGARVYTWGDLHGGFHSLVNMLSKLFEEKIIDENFLIIDPKCYLMFLGDFVDRGLFGPEILYFLLRLKNANPDQVILVRGNHEDPSMNNKCGFTDELRIKMGENYTEIAKMISGFYNLLPLANEINRQVLCCHGCLDHCYDNRRLREHPGLFACELISEKTYNPHNIASKLSGECLAGIADEMMTVARIEHSNVLSSEISKMIKILENYEQEMLSFDCEEVFEPDDIEAFNDEKTEFDKSYAFFREILIQVQEFATRGSVNDKILGIIDSSVNAFEMMSQEMDELENIASHYIEHGAVDYRTVAQMQKYHRRIGKIKLEKQASVFRKIFEVAYVVRLKNCIVTILKKAKNVTEAQAVSKRCGIKYEDLPRSLHEFLIDHMGTMPRSLKVCGLAWNDANTDTDEKCPDILMREKARYCLGKRLCHEMMRIQGIRCVLRAHQHSGNMAKLLGKLGVVELWGMDTGSVLSLKDLSVYTLQVAYSAGSRNALDPIYVVDVFTCLHIHGEEMTTWELEKIIVPYGKEITGGPKAAAKKE